MDQSYYLEGLNCLMYLAGVWPLKHIDSRTFRIIYSWYSKILHIFSVIFLVAQLTQLLVLWIKDSSMNTGTIGFFILEVIDMARILVLESSSIQGLFDEILDNQNRIMNYADEQLQTIYISHSKRTKRLSFIYVTLGTLALVIFNISGVAMEMQINYDASFGNVSHAANLNVDVWVPFNREKHYHILFCLVMGPAQIAACYYITTKSLILVLISHAVGQIKVQQYLFRNLGKVDDYKKNQFKTVKYCVEEHLKIINYVTILNSCFKYTILLEFGVLSLWLAVSLFSIISRELDMVLIVNLTFLPVILTQLFVQYWYANELKVQSLKLSLALYESDWYNESESNKKSLVIMLMASQKPLTLTIGDFDEMSTETALVILKTSYSYLMLFLNYR